MTTFTESTIEQAAIEWLKGVCTMIRMISGRTLMELERNHSVHSIREIIVPDDLLLPKLIPNRKTKAAIWKHSYMSTGN